MELMSAENARNLEFQGFGVAELTGFEDHRLPLYAHRKLGDKSPGDVVLLARIGNPDALDDGEASYLARKAFHGMFPWAPGSDCLKRSFIDVSIAGPGNGDAGNQVQRSECARGCKWCRKPTPRRRSAPKRSKNGPDGASESVASPGTGA